VPREQKKEKQAILAHYLRAMGCISYQDLATRHGVSKRSVANYIKQSGVETRVDGAIARHPERFERMAKERKEREQKKRRLAMLKNDNAEKHGFYSKRFEGVIADIMDEYEDFTFADMLYMQIKVAFANFVRSSEMLKTELKDRYIYREKHLKPDTGENYDVSGEKVSKETVWVNTYEVQSKEQEFSHITNAINTSTMNVASLIERFRKLVHEDDPRLVSLSTMDKEMLSAKTALLKAEAEKVQSDAEGSPMLRALLELKRGVGYDEKEDRYEES
jgi:uncharacterized protein YjcR